MNRRNMLGNVAKMGVGLALAGEIAAADGPRSLPEPSAKKLPRWRGFNLLEMFMASEPNQVQRFRESDFAAIAELGFDFVRLPMDYRFWTDPKDWTKLREERLKWVDEAVGFGRKHAVHVQLNFHRAPGYTVANPPEPKSLWDDPDALAASALHWGTFASRYKGIPSRELSFDLFNEPARVGPEAYRKVVARMVETIHGTDPARLIVADGRDWGTKPPTELVDLGVASATRGYAPFHLTHYKASWAEGSDTWARPEYPFRESGKTWDRAAIQAELIAPWKRLEAQGVGVMVGEFGCFNKTPHAVVLAWMRDCLDAWKAAGWGWALWNFRGGFGILDSDREDVKYESWRGHKLDRAMLEILQAR
jgi:endoglucanase